MVIIIALLHCLPPIIGAFFGKTGLKIGIAIGVVSAFAIGAVVFTVFDLICVAIGAMIGLGIVQNQEDSRKSIGDMVDDVSEAVDRGTEAASNFLAKLIGVLFVGLIVVGLGVELFEPESESEKIRKTAIMSNPNDLVLSCNSGDKNGCLKLGIKYVNETRNYRDSRAIEAFERGCNLGSGESCSRLAERYEIKDYDTLARSQNMEDLKKAFDLNLKACNLGYAGGCAAVASDYEFGNYPATKSLSNALELFKKANELNDSWKFNYNGDISRLEKKMNPYKY